MKTALVIIIVSLLMLVGCSCFEPAPVSTVTPPAPEQPTSSIPSTYQPTEPNPPVQSWDSQHPDTTSSVSTTNTTIPSVPEKTYPSIPFYFWYTSPYIPPIQPTNYGSFWIGSVGLTVQ